MADDTLRAAITTALAENGVNSRAPSGIHSWRCEYPDRYGPCSCLDELVDDLVRAVRAALDGES